MLRTLLFARWLSLAGLVGLSLSGSATPAATLILEYNAQNWNGTSIPDSAPNAPTGASIMPTAGTNSNSSYGAPVYVSSGAGPQSRPYFDFQKFGTLSNSGIGGSWLNSPDNNGTAQGYTMEGYFLLKSGSGLANITNTGIGFTQGTSNENQFIAFTGGGLSSQTQTATQQTGAESYRTETTDLNSVLPRDQWFDLVKVVDPVADNVRFYLDGHLVLTDNSWSPTSPLTPSVYRDRGEDYGSAGNLGRELEGLQYSLTRFYTGVLSDSQIAANYAQITFVAPEPGTLMLAIAGCAGLVLAGRRRKACQRRREP
jgi:hypothetical protein